MYIKQTISKKNLNENYNFLALKFQFLFNLVTKNEVQKFSSIVLRYNLSTHTHTNKHIDRIDQVNIFNKILRITNNNNEKKSK